MGDFGDKFRKAREKKELTLDNVSNVTKISARMLRAIEEEHFDELPGGVFNKGFIRAYAKHLGLDAEEAVTDYLASLRQAQIDAQEVWEPQIPAAAGSSADSSKVRVAEPNGPVPKSPAPKPPTPLELAELPEMQLPRAEDIRPARKDYPSGRATEIPWRLVAAAALVGTLGIFLWTRHSNTTRAVAPSQTKIATASAAQPASLSASAEQPPVPSKPSSSAAAALASAAAPSTQPSNQPPIRSASTQPTTTAPTPAPGTAETSDVTIRNFGKSKAKPAEKSAASLSLLIRATENSWISVLADGQLVTQETLIAPAQTSVRATREITVRVGNAAGVTFFFNKTAIPSQGNEGEAKTLTFDTSGLKSSATLPTSTEN